MAEKEILEQLPESIQKMVYEQLKEKFEKPEVKKPTKEEIKNIVDAIMK